MALDERFDFRKARRSLHWTTSGYRQRTAGIGILQRSMGVKP